MSTLDYVKNFASDRFIASITPTSPFGVRKVCGKIDFQRCRVAVEYGPGTGVFTKYLLRNMSPEARLILIERNANFAAILRERFRDPRLAVANCDAARVLDVLESCGRPRADCIVSGIPFSFFSDEARNDILGASRAALREGGKFLAYQTFYQADSHLKAHLEKLFRSVGVEYEILNVPPLRIYEAVR